ncbi:MAG TPA: hypothetical protein VFE62_18700 [Gemmataceae bacterium]|nr:hypothetical protein [Gemmataceae bacterium]
MMEKRFDCLARISASWAFLCGVAALLVFAGWSYFFLIGDYPYHHGDESSFLNIPYRVCEFGDASYPAVYSSSWGSERARMYPPVSAFGVRNGFHAIVGFSSTKSRMFSALLMLAVIASSIIFLWRMPELNGWQRLLVLSQLGLPPVMIYTARTVRFEQEILFAGWIGAAAIPALIPSVGYAWLRMLLWVGAGAALGLAGTTHPFGLAFGIVGVWLIYFANYWHEQDGLRAWHRLGLVGIGAILTGIPTFHWIFRDWETFRAFSLAHAKLYAERTSELVDWYAGMPPWNHLRGILPESIVAHLTVLHQASYEDFYNYPVPDYRFRVFLEVIFYVQLVLVTAFFAYSAWRRFQNANPWVHLAVWLAVAFLVFGFWYTPIHTYKIYTSFFVNLSSSLIAWRLVNELRTRTSIRAIWIAAAVAAAIPALFFLHFACCHARHLIACQRHGTYTHVALDVELNALADMADRLELRRDDRKVYTYLESWIAAGKHSLSLWESVREGIVEPRTDADGVVFHNNNVGAFLRVQPRDSAERIAKRRQQLDRLRTLLAPMQLAGVIVNDFQPSAAYSFYQRAADQALPLRVARLQHDQQVVSYETSFDRDIPSIDTPILLEPGVYLLLARVDAGAKADLLDVSYANGSETIKKSVYLTPLHTVTPAPVLIEITGTAPVPLQLAFTPNEAHLATAQLYRLHSPRGTR